MNQEKTRKLSTPEDRQLGLARIVGSILVNPEAERSHLILVPIDQANRANNQRINLFDLQILLKDIKSEVTPEETPLGSLRRSILFPEDIVFHEIDEMVLRAVERLSYEHDPLFDFEHGQALLTNEHGFGPYELTDRGKTVLGSIVLSEEVN